MQNCSYYTGTENGPRHHWVSYKFSAPTPVKCDWALKKGHMKSRPFPMCVRLGNWKTLIVTILTSKLFLLCKQVAAERRMKRLGATEQGPEIVTRMKRFAATRVQNWRENKQVQYVKHTINAFWIQVDHYPWFQRILIVSHYVSVHQLHYLSPSNMAFTHATADISVNISSVPNKFCLRTNWFPAYFPG